MTSKKFDEILKNEKESRELFEHYRNGYYKALKDGFGGFSSGKLRASELNTYFALKENLAKFASAKHSRIFEDKKNARAEHTARFKTEINQTIAQAQIAKKWVGFDAENSNLKYQTAKDDFVRPGHKKLDGIVKKAKDPFWLSHTPPLGWGCRCNVIETNDPVSDGTPDVGYDNGYEGVHPFYTGQIFSDKHPTFGYYDADWTEKQFSQDIDAMESFKTKKGVSIDKGTIAAAYQKATNKIALGVQISEIETILANAPVVREIDGKIYYEIDINGIKYYYVVMDNTLQDIVNELPNG